MTQIDTDKLLALDEKAAECVDRAITRLRALPDYAGRPAWDAVVAEEIRALILAISAILEIAEENAGLREDVTRQMAAANSEANRAEDLLVENRWLREALEPFAAFAATFVDDEGWKYPPMKERIVDWFGPSDFRAARQVFASGDRE